MIMNMEDGHFSQLSATPLSRFERAPIGLSFAYSRPSILFLLCSKMATDLSSQFSHVTLYVTMLLIILRDLGSFLGIWYGTHTSSIRSKISF